MLLISHQICLNGCILDVNKENEESVNIEQEHVGEDMTEVDIATLAGLLETCAIIWEGIKDHLEKVLYVLQMNVARFSQTKYELFCSTIVKGFF